MCLSYAVTLLFLPSLAAWLTIDIVVLVMSMDSMEWDYNLYQEWEDDSYQEWKEKEEEWSPKNAEEWKEAPEWK